MRHTLSRWSRLAIVLLLLFAVLTVARPGEATYDPGDANEHGDTRPASTIRHHHRAGAMAGGLKIGYMTWPRQDRDGDPYGNDGGGFLVGLLGQYYFVDNLAAFANLDFAFGEYTTLTRVVLGAQYNLPLSTSFTVFAGAGLALDMAGWKEFPFEERGADDPPDRNSAFYRSGNRTNVGFNLTGGLEIFVTDQISIRPSAGFDFAGSLHMILGMGVGYYF